MLDSERGPNLEVLPAQDVLMAVTQSPSSSKLLSCHSEVSKYLPWAEHRTSLMRTGTVDARPGPSLKTAQISGVQLWGSIFGTWGARTGETPEGGDDPGTAFHIGTFAASSTEYHPISRGPRYSSYFGRVL